MVDGYSYSALLVVQSFQSLAGFVRLRSFRNPQGFPFANLQTFGLLKKLGG